MRACAIALVVTMGLCVLPAAATPIIDNNHIYCWGDPFGEQFDCYAEVERGETIVLQVWVNDLDGSVDSQTGETLVEQDGEMIANGLWTCTWWDPLVVDWSSVHEHREGTYYSDYWPYFSYNAHGANYRYRHYYNNIGSQYARWVAEGKEVINVCYTIREDAPMGTTTIGLEQVFRWVATTPEEANVWFFGDRIESDTGDPYAMTLNVVPEPATLCVMGCGAIGLLHRRRRA